MPARAGLRPVSKPGARRRRNRVGRIAVGEPHAVFRQRINVRRRDVLAAIRSDVGVAKVVGEEDEDVRTSLGDD
jgi:hypothetical protein